MKDNKAFKFSETVKSSKKIAESLESENFFIIDDELLCELSSTLLSKTLSKTDFQALIVAEKQSIDKLFKSFIINLIKTEASATISMNKKFFYATEIETKLRLTHS